MSLFKSVDDRNRISTNEHQLSILSFEKVHLSWLIRVGLLHDFCGILRSCASHSHSSLHERRKALHCKHCAEPCSLLVPTALRMAIAGYSFSERTESNALVLFPSLSPSYQRHRRRLHHWFCRRAFHCSETPWWHHRVEKIFFNVSTNHTQPTAESRGISWPRHWKRLKTEKWSKNNFWDRLSPETDFFHGTNVLPYSGANSGATWVGKQVWRMILVYPLTLLVNIITEHLYLFFQCM